MAIVLKNKNFAKSTLAANITSGATSLTVATSDGAKFPSTGSFRAVIWGASYSSPTNDITREIVTVTVVAGDVLTITRAVESTAAKAWSSSDQIAHVITAGKIDELETEINIVVIPTGTVMVFFQAAAPTGWTQNTTHTDKALRVVSGAGGGSAGTHGFSTHVANSGHTHTVASSGGHAHGGNSIAPPGGPDFYFTGASPVGEHTHTTDSGALGWSPLYIDVIVCSKN